MNGPFRQRLYTMKHKVYQIHIKKTTIALLLILPYLASEWSARAYNLYATFPVIDTVTHVLFGVAFAALAYLIYNKSTTFTLGGILSVSLVWELLEITGDLFVPAAAAILDPFFYDGLKDILVSVAGSAVTLFIIKKSIKRHYVKLKELA